MLLLLIGVLVITEFKSGSGFHSVNHIRNVISLDKETRGSCAQSNFRTRAISEGQNDVQSFFKTFRKMAACSVIGMGVMLDCFPSISRAVDSSKGVLSEVWSLVDENFVDPSYNGNDWNKVKDDYFARVKSGGNEAELTKKMMSLLGDKYSRFLDKKVFEGLWKYDAIGVGLLFQSDEITGRQMFVAAPPIGGSSAEKAGIKKDDTIFSINGASTEKMTAIQLLEMMSNDDGDSIAMEYSSGGGTKKTVTLARSKQKATNPVSYSTQRLSNGKLAGYVRLSEFNSEAIPGLKTALDNMNKEGTDELLLDLRGNTGGGFQFALNIGGMFMDSSKEMVTAQGKNPTEKNVFKTSYPEGVIYKKPVVVYTDGLSASASEVLVAGLHDNCRATTTGETTFGKGKIQAVFGLADGEGIALTVAQYITPKGNIIQSTGVQPDIPASLPANQYVNAIIGPSPLTKPNLENIKFDQAEKIINMCTPLTAAVPTPATGAAQ